MNKNFWLIALLIWLFFASTCGMLWSCYNSRAIKNITGNAVVETYKGV